MSLRIDSVLDCSEHGYDSLVRIRQENFLIDGQLLASQYPA
jgi:hypothetical protein